MPERLLFVDDESTLLRSMNRAFGLDFDVASALSGPEAIKLLNGDQPYPVVVTDMRMPGMNGVEFIQAARRVSPESVYIMLTGNQDVETATRAVNDGEVYRFLHKPCDVDNLRRAIESAIRQHDLVHGEKELLQKTFVGAVSCVSGVLERAYPELAGAGAVVSDVIGFLCRETGIDDRWEFTLAGRLSLVGFALLGDDLARMNTGIDPISTEGSVYPDAAVEAAKLIAKIPRLEGVVKIIEAFPNSDGAVCNLHPNSRAAICDVGAALLRIALQARHAFHQGVESKQMADEVKASLPNIQESIYEALRRLHDDREATYEGVAVPLKMLNPGMVLQADLETPSGDKLLRQGRRLDAASIEKLDEALRHASNPRAMITTTSYEAFSKVGV